MLSRRWEKFKQINKKTFFMPEDVSSVLNIETNSARVLCSRYSKNGIFIKLKNNYYAFAAIWELNKEEDFFQVANVLQVPSYVSFMTALAHYGITSQVQRNFFESVSVKRTVQYNVKDSEFLYCKLNKKYYFDFVKKGSFFIATPEKAFLDCVYLFSFGKYRADFDSISVEKLNKKKILGLLTKYPERIKKSVKKICRI